MKYLGLAICVLALCLYSCTSETEDILQKSNMGILEARKIARTYLVLEGERYVLNLGIDDAEKKGISRNLYTQLLQEVEESNLFLQELMNEGRKVSLLDPQEDDDNLDVMIKTRNEVVDNVLVRGSLRVSNYQTTTSINAPRGSKRIVFTGTTPCFFVAISIICNGSAGTITNGPWGGSCTFPIPLSPTVLTVTTHTLCSDGGSLSYAIYNN